MKYVCASVGGSDLPAVREARLRRAWAPFWVCAMWPGRDHGADPRRSCDRTRAENRHPAWSKGAGARNGRRSPLTRQPVPCGNLGHPRVLPYEIHHHLPVATTELGAV